MKKQDILSMIETLKKTYPDAKCSLNFHTPFELMVAVMLSAQCTDERVNQTTPKLFEKYNTPSDFANMELSTLEEYIHPCGFYRNKAKNIKAASQKILSDFHGEVPHSMEELVSLPGVGRKSANVIMLEAYHDPQGIAVDTHAKRISNRIGFSSASEPSIIEQDLLKLFPKKYYEDINHLFIWHGRAICSAPHPKCEKCPIRTYCEYDKKKKSSF